MCHQLGNINEENFEKESSRNADVENIVLITKIYK
jgi:hypothetical protein